MNINISKDHIFMIIDALESYQIDIQYGNHNGYEYPWTEDEIQGLIDILDTFLEKDSLNAN